MLSQKLRAGGLQQGCISSKFMAPGRRYSGFIQGTASLIRGPLSQRADDDMCGTRLTDSHGRRLAQVGPRRVHHVHPRQLAALRTRYHSLAILDALES